MKIVASADQAATSGDEVSSMSELQLDLLDRAQHYQVHHDGHNSGLCVKLGHYVR